MATFPTPDQILTAFRAEGLTVYEMPGWRGRCRCCSGPHNPRASSYIRPWRQFHGVTWHMTYGARLSGQAAIDYTQRILIGGNGSVPGPLCLAGVDANGRILMVSAGRANHIGSISQRSLDAMRGASFSTAGNHNLRGSGVDGNAYTLGFEGLGAGQPNAAQWEAMVKASVALCRLAGWTGQEVHGHGECSDQRSFTDPGCDMGAVRREVMARLRRGTTPTTTAPAAPKAAPPQEGKVPTFHRTVTEFDTEAGRWRLPPDTATVVKPSAKRLLIDANAIIHVPEGVKVSTRWVSWSGRPDPGWVRGPIRRHESHQAETTTKVEQAWPGADLRLDVMTDKPCTVKVIQEAMCWELD